MACDEHSILTAIKVAPHGCACSCMAASVVGQPLLLPAALFAAAAAAVTDIFDKFLPVTVRIPFWNVAIGFVARSLIHQFFKQNVSRLLKMSCKKANRPTISAMLLASLLSFASCQDMQPVMMNNPNGLQVAWNPGNSSIGVWRRLPQMTTPAPTSTGSMPPAATTSSATPPPTNSTTAPPTGSSTPSPMTTPLPPPTTTTAAPVPVTGRINVTMCSIQEMDINGSVVATFSAFQTIGLGGPQTLSPPVMVASLPGSSGQTAVQATCQLASGQIPLTNSTSGSSNPLFNVTICLVTASGSVSYGNEMIPMMVGQLVAMVGVQNWQWTSTGVNLILNLTITAPNGRQISVNSQNSTYMNMSLGTASSYALLSSKIMSNVNSYLPMASGYPAISMSNNKQSATILVMMPQMAGPQTTWTGLIDPGYTPAGPPPGPVSAAVRLHEVFTSLLFVLACCTSVMIFFRQ